MSGRSVVRIHKRRLTRNFSQFDNDRVWDKTLSVEARMVLIAMFTLKDGTHLTREQLAARIGMSDRKVKAALAELDEAGFRHVTRRHLPDGTMTWETDWYDEPHDAPVTVTGEPSTIGPQRSNGPDLGKDQELAGQTIGTPRSNGTSLYNKNTPPTPASGGSQPPSQPKKPQPRGDRKKDEPQEPELFARFYAAYPRKLGKQAAVKAWNKAVKGGVAPEVILRGIEQQAEILERRERQFVPHPATWLNQGRWEDDPDELDDGGGVVAGSRIVAPARSWLSVLRCRTVRGAYTYE